MGFLAPAALALAATIPIIIAMYLLKLRRTEQAVSSVYLWRRMVRDVEANAPWQKLRRNLLLFVQILFLAALVLALARPFTWTQGVSGQAAILILDVSASMAATDVAPSRLGAARAQAQRLVDGLADEVRVTVIAAGDGAQVLAASSLDRRQVRVAISRAGSTGGAQVGAASSDLTAALELASAIAARQPDTEIIVFSDGRVTLPERLAIQEDEYILGHVRYMPLGLRGDNQAISLLSLQAAGGGLTAFAQVTNYGSAPAQRRLALYTDGQLVSAYDLEVAPGAQQVVVADDLPAETRVLEARLDGEDILSLDDQAWAVYRRAEPVAVTLVTEGNLFLETALALFPHLQVTTAKPQDFEEWAAGLEGRKVGRLEATPSSPPIFQSSSLPSSSLTILDAYVPITATLPSGNLLFIAPPRSTRFFSVTGMVEQPVPRAVPATGGDGTAGDPLLMHVNLAEVSVLEAVRLPLPSWARPVIAGDSVAGDIAGDTTPLLFVGESGAQRVAVLAFDLRRSDLPLQVAFPLLLANLVGWLAPGGGTMPAQVAPGAAVPLTLPPEVESVRVTYPDGSTARLAVQGGQAILADTRQLGVYQVEWGSDASAGVTAFAVDLFSPSESNVQPVANLPLVGTGEGGEKSGNAPQQARREWWRPLAWAALALLTVEWFVYQRATLARLWAMARKAFVASWR